MKLEALKGKRTSFLDSKGEGELCTIGKEIFAGFRRAAFFIHLPCNKYVTDTSTLIRGGYKRMKISWLSPPVQAYGANINININE